MDNKEMYYVVVWALDTPTDLYNFCVLDIVPVDAVENNRFLGLPPSYSIWIKDTTEDHINLSKTEFETKYNRKLSYPYET